ncbi:MAG: hypothetical protein ACYCSB_04770 [bacterium]
MKRNDEIVPAGTYIKALSAYFGPPKEKIPIKEQILMMFSIIKALHFIFSRAKTQFLDEIEVAKKEIIRSSFSAGILRKIEAAPENGRQIATEAAESNAPPTAQPINTAFPALEILNIFSFQNNIDNDELHVLSNMGGAR